MTISAAITTQTKRDVQREALRQLVDLSAQCASRETEIEERYKKEIEEADLELEKANWGIEQRHKSLSDQIEQRYDEKKAEIAATYNEGLGDLNSGDSRLRNRIAQEHDAVTREVKKQYDQAMWMADSVFEVAKNRVKADFKKASDEIEAYKQAVEDMRQQMNVHVRNYGQVPPPTPAAPPEPEAGKAAEEMVKQKGEIERGLAKLRNLTVPKLFVGPMPWIVGILLPIVAGVIGQVASGQTEFQVTPVAISAGVALVLVIIGGLMLRSMARAHVAAVVNPLMVAIEAAIVAAKVELRNAENARQTGYSRAEAKYKNEVQTAKAIHSPVLTKAAKHRDGSLRSAASDHETHLGTLQAQRDRSTTELEQWRERKTKENDQKKVQELEHAKAHHAKRREDNQRKYDHDRAELKRHWEENLKRIQIPMSGHDASAGSNGQTPQDWGDPAWKAWQPPRRFASQVRFGELGVDLKAITDRVPHQLELPGSLMLPAILAFPRQSSLLIQTDREGRPQAIATLQMAMARLLTSVPPGRVRFTIIDPVALGQNFAGFMHLADHDEALVGSRIWTEAEHIEQRLADLTEHMETVIQKYLRNEFETIDDYNAQAGELAEPYRFLVIADLPIGFSSDAMRRLASIASSGARCGVYTLIMRDMRQPLPGGSHMDEVEANSVVLVRQGDHFVWKDEVFKQFPLKLDRPPGEDFLTPILDIVGKRAKESKRVEVPFESIAPPAEKIWSSSCKDELAVPIGRMGATRQQFLRLGRGVQQHLLIAGKTGSGKSTLLHALITNLAMWFSADEVEFYLIDFKKGVEFKTYATHSLPHARAIAVESDREFGLSVLQRLDAELGRRGQLFRKLGVQDLPAYRETAKQSMPRTLLIIDEFQEFFSEDDKLAQDAGLLLDRLVRQGRAFGIHVLLGSQTIGGSSGLARSTIGQMAVRIALQTSEADSQLILGDNNSAARLLSRPGEAIYNDAGGLVEGNSPFQIAWLSDEQREGYLKKVQERAQRSGRVGEEPIVFEGNAPAEIRKNRKLMGLISASQWPAPTVAPVGWLGEPVAIKEPTGVALRKQSGANMLIIGQQEESAMALMASMLISLASQHRPSAAQFYVLDGSPADSPLAAVFGKLKAHLPHAINLVDYRSAGEAIVEFGKELAKRQAEEMPEAPTIYLLIYGMQRYRVLRKTEESFGFNASEEEKGPAPDKVFMDLLREGPPLGIHVIAWADTAAAIERTLDRTAMREFDNRVLFQMSANDSSNLIDSPLANKLGFHRALAYSEEQGVVEKFRPYALIDQALLEQIKKSWSARV